MCPSDGSANNRRPESLANGRFAVTKKLGSGSFGEVYIGVDKESGEEVAIKFEDLLSGFLNKEVSVLKALQQHQAPARGFARLLYSGKEEGGLKCMVMDRLGSNLLQHMTACGGRFDPATAVLVAQQSLICVEYLHSKAVVHRDMKPENFLIGRGPREHHVHLIDFGLATEFYINKAHVEQRPVSGFHGSFRYASCDAHRCSTQSRRSDLESLGFVLIYLARGSLPWAGIQAKDWRVRSQLVLDAKESADPSELATGLPEAFGEFLACAQGLNFSARPEYDLLHDMFEQARSRLSGPGDAPLEEYDVAWRARAAGGTGGSGGSEAALTRQLSANAGAEISRFLTRGSSLDPTLKRQSDRLSSRTSQASQISQASRTARGSPRGGPRQIQAMAAGVSERAVRPFLSRSNSSEGLRFGRRVASEPDRHGKPRIWGRMCGAVAKVAEPRSETSPSVSVASSPVQGLCSTPCSTPGWSASRKGPAAAALRPEG